MASTATDIAETPLSARRALDPRRARATARQSAYRARQRDGVAMISWSACIGWLTKTGDHRAASRRRGLIAAKCSEVAALKRVTV
jgi:hypothetical protein